jgi:hypothetical protein
MPMIETIKEKAKRITGIGRPTRREVDTSLRPRKPSVLRFADDGIIPNNARLPMIFYRGPVRTVDAPDPAALFEVLFERNGWKSSLRNGIFDYVHYHSQIHEVLGIARGHATVRFGGSQGRVISSSQATLRSYRQERDTSDSMKVTIFWSSGHTPGLENTIYAAPRRRSTVAP